MRVRTEQGGPTAVDAGPGEIGLELDPAFPFVGCVRGVQVVRSFSE